MLRIVSGFRNKETLFVFFFFRFFVSCDRSDKISTCLRIFFSRNFHCMVLNRAVLYHLVGKNPCWKNLWWCIYQPNDIPALENKKKKTKTPEYKSFSPFLIVETTIRLQQQHSSRLQRIQQHSSRLYKIESI